MDVIPLKVPVCLQSLQFAASASLFAVWASCAHGFTGDFVGLVASAPLSVIAECFGCFTLVQLAAIRRKLDGQLADFQAADAECFCCCNNHIHPVTGEIMSCDRIFVEE